MKTLKKIYLIMACVTFTLASAQNPAIPSPAFGINLWMPDHYITGSSTWPGGVANFKNIETMVDNLSSAIIRVGGGDIDLNGVSISTATTTNDYARFIQQVKYRVPNAKFIIQIPYASNNYGFNTGNALTLVQNLVAIFPSDVFYYSIGNEWDSYSSTQKTISNVATQFKAFAKTIKENDPHAIVLSPNFTSFYAYDAVNSFYYYQELFRPASSYYIGGYIPSGTQMNKPYCDIIDMHTYPSEITVGCGTGLYGLSNTNYGTVLTTMQNHPQGKFKNELAPNTSSGYNGLQLLISNCSRTSTATYPLKIAYTEINVTYQNPTLSSESSTSITENTFDGIACRSFFAGQWLMEMYCSFLVNSSDEAAFMIPWSIHESGGDGKNIGDGEDLSITRGSASSSVDPTPVPTYYHYEMLADNLRNCTNILKATTNNSAKVFGAYNTLTGANAKFVAIIMNQTTSAITNLTVQLNNSTPSGNYSIMNFPGGPNVGYNMGTLAANSTVVLIFNYGGEMLRHIEYRLSDGKNAAPAYADYPYVNSNAIAMIDLGPNQSGCCTVPLLAYPSIGGATYAWYKNSDDFTTSIASGPGYYVPSGANYTYKCVVTYNGQTAWDYVKGTNTGGCCRITGINNEIDDENTFYAMPNPTQNNVTIKYILPEYATVGTITLSDLAGKVIKSIPVSNSYQTVEVDCKQLSNGLYFYSLNVGGKIQSCKKLVIAK